MLRTTFFIVFLLTAGQLLHAQQSVLMTFAPFLDGAPLEIDANRSTPTDSVKIHTLRFYAGQFGYYTHDSLVFQQREYYLIDATKTGGLSINTQVPDKLEYDEIRFLIGVDSSTSSAGAFEGALDPTKGMYWTWRSGYIHFKLEGSVANCPARNHEFQYHIGGYQGPFNGIRQIALPAEAGKNLNIRINLNRFFDQIDPAVTYQVMSPNQASVYVANVLPTIFSTQTKTP